MFTHKVDIETEIKKKMCIVKANLLHKKYLHLLKIAYSDSYECAMELDN